MEKLKVHAPGKTSQNELVDGERRPEETEMQNTLYDQLVPSLKCMRGNGEGSRCGSVREMAGRQRQKMKIHYIRSLFFPPPTNGRQAGVH